jgi:Pyruvate/2-oxoacid:ferredoxin oxidoreductase delta subunit
MLVDIYAEVKPTLTVIDGITALEGDGPGTGGKLRHPGLLLAGTDCVALDSVLALIMGLKPQDILTNREAAKRGLGIADISRIDIAGEKLEKLIEAPFCLPATSITKRIPRPIINVAKKLIRFYPAVKQNKCILCQACVKACPMKVISVESNRITIKYHGCISCFCCHEVCPAAAMKVKKSILAKIIGL